MNFQQLKIIREAARRDYNLTEVANMLYTSQSGVSRHIRELEEELGIEIFIRRGKRLLGMTEPGKALLTIAERILNEASNVRRLADLFTNDASGVLTIATTHTQARYSLPPVIKAFRELFPEVRLELIQGTPQEIEVLLQNGGADIGIASERLSNDPLLVAFPWFRWYHSLLLPVDHPLNQVSPLTLEDVAKWPLITYRQGITGRSRIDEAFNRKGLTPDIVLSAQDSDVIKTYVELGLGIGLVAEQSSGEREDGNLVRLDTRHLFDANTVWLGLKRGQLQRNYVWRFIELCNAGLSVDEIKRQVMEPEEVAEAFDLLEGSGKVRHFGVSNHTPMQIQLLKKCVRQDLLVNQLQFSIPFSNMVASGLEANMLTDGAVNRDNSVLDFCRLHDMTIQAWSPFQYGFFEGVFVDSEKYPELNQVLADLAEKYGTTKTGIASAWIFRHPAKIQMVAGTTNLKRLREIALAADIRLTREEWYQLYLSAGHILP